MDGDREMTCELRYGYASNLHFYKLPDNIEAVALGTIL